MPAWHRMTMASNDKSILLMPWKISICIGFWWFLYHFEAHFKRFWMLQKSLQSDTYRYILRHQKYWFVIRCHRHSMPCGHLEWYKNHKNPRCIDILDGVKNICAHSVAPAFVSMMVLGQNIVTWFIRWKWRETNEGRNITFLWLHC